jgi:hypothetical protein
MLAAFLVKAQLPAGTLWSKILDTCGLILVESVRRAKYLATVISALRQCSRKPGAVHGNPGKNLQDRQGGHRWIPCFWSPKGSWPVRVIIILDCGNEIATETLAADELRREEMLSWFDDNVMPKLGSHHDLQHRPAARRRRNPVARSRGGRHLLIGAAGTGKISL